MKTASETKSGSGFMLLIICLGVFMVYLDSTIVNTALPSIQQSFGLGVSGLQWLLDIYVLAFACMLMTAGTLGDLFGRKKLFIASLAGFTLSSVVCALAPNVGTLFAGRVLQGLFGSAVIPMSLALITVLYPLPAARARAVGLWAGIGGLALAGGPIIGGLLIDSIGWESIFWINVPIGILAVIILAMKLKVQEVTVNKRIDFIGQVLFILGIAALTFALIQGSSEGWGSLLIIGSFAVSVLCLVLFYLWEHSCSYPMLPPDFFRNRIFIMACLVNLLSFFGMFGVMFLMTLFFQTINQLTPTETGIRFLALTGAIMIGSYVTPRIYSRIGTRTTIIIGAFMTAGGLLGLLNVGPGSGFAAYGWPMMLIGLGVSLAGAPATMVLLSSVPLERAGAASGASQTFRQVGSIFGIALSGSILLYRMKTEVPGAFADAPLTDDA
ncbi:DHA2 family efflux MFS transporter permease subunit, partial [Paenibacillus sepulcri]|nr:DHA2 family efflux MFS transporter permease subunit [Paenibacillus sepulcri]